jgi:ribosomal protein S20
MKKIDTNIMKKRPIKSNRKYSAFRPIIPDNQNELIIENNKAKRTFSTLMLKTIKFFDIIYS